MISSACCDKPLSVNSPYDTTNKKSLQIMNIMNIKQKKREAKQRRDLKLDLDFAVVARCKTAQIHNMRIKNHLIIIRKLF